MDDSVGNFLTSFPPLPSEFSKIVDLSPAGELKVNDPYYFDFEAAEKLEIPVRVLDSDTSVSSVITINIENEEDGLLNNYDSDLIKYFEFLVYWQDTPTMTSDRLRLSKYLAGTGRIPVYVQGSAANDENIDKVLETITLINRLVEGSFTLFLTNSEQEAQVGVLLGTRAELQELWPSLYNFVNELNLTGAIAGNLIFVDENAEMQHTIMHEFGHLVGLGHSRYCSVFEVLRYGTSVMCTSGGRITTKGLENNVQDADVIRLLYHPSIIDGMTVEESIPIVESILLGQKVTTVETNTARSLRLRKRNPIMVP